MLQKRIDNGSIPYGLAVAGEDIVKGSLVKLTVVGGVEKAVFADATDGANMFGFAYNTIKTDEGSIKTNDTIKTDERLVVYTLHAGNTWATTQYVDDAGLVAGALATIADDGKIKIKGELDTAYFVVVEEQAAGVAYTDALLTVRIL